MGKYWTVMYCIYQDHSIPVTEHFATRKDARRFKKALKMAPKIYSKISLHKSFTSPLGGFVVSPIKEY
ncbi:hypothetical protein PQC58_gp066 [Escherichia phage Paul]|uniref:Uncharacterized protein n=1 Tax=Escherichia phage Paul TaxID=2589659 RepID=A0A5B9N6I6_9CAUD|nr:hypothetical protein PQC58_gp066 [Escherichia phage Paul]QEG08162.1 hypothetical protein CPT_Paul_066 [Escherichia phage Paul]